MNKRSLMYCPTVLMLVFTGGGAVMPSRITSATYKVKERLAAIATRMPYRHFDGAVSNFAWRPFQAKPIELRPCPKPLKRSRTRDELCRKRAPEAKHLCGLAALFDEDWHAAADSLHEATELAPQNAVYWSDLAVAFEAIGRAERDSQQFVAALAASDRALRLRPDFDLALFNRATALELLGLTLPAIRAYARCMRHPENRWAQEAAERVRRLRSGETVTFNSTLFSNLTDRQMAETIARVPIEVRTFVEDRLLPDWARHELACETTAAEPLLALARRIARLEHMLTADSTLIETIASIDRATPTQRMLLAEGHRAFGEARDAYRSGRRHEAERKFIRASNRFEAGESMGMWQEAGFLRNNCLEDPHIITVPGIMKTGALDDSLQSDLDALATFVHTPGMPQPFMTGSEDSRYPLLGHRAEAWRKRSSFFRNTCAAGDVRGLRQAIRAAAEAEALDGHWDTAHALLCAATDLPEQGGPAEMAQIYAWRGLSAERMRWHAETDDDLARARLEITRIPNLRAAETFGAIVLFAEAVAIRDTDPRAAIKKLTSLIEHSPFPPPWWDFLAETFFERAHARRALADKSAAIADLNAALSALSSHRRYALDQMDAYFPLADAIIQELIDLYDGSGNHAEALRTARRGYEGDRNPTTERPPAGMIIARYVALPDRLLIFLTTTNGTSAIHVPVSYAEIHRAVQELSESIESGDEKWREPANRLGAWLIDPVPLSGMQTLAVIANRSLAQVPFCTLPRSTTHRPVVEDVAVAMVWRPWTRLWPEKSIGPGAIAAVGDPAFDFSGLLTLDRLPAAALQAKDAVKAYGGGVLLTGTAATTERVCAALAENAVADIAMHAITFPDDPSRSFLLLAPSQTNSGLLYLPEIERMDLTNLRLVVLTGCRTAAPTMTGDSTNSLARAFLAAGARNVIGSLWPLDDEVGRAVSSNLHREILAGVSPEEALRRVQVSMLHSSNSELRRLGSWTGLRLYSRLETQQDARRLLNELRPHYYMGRHYMGYGVPGFPQFSHRKSAGGAFLDNHSLSGFSSCCGRD
jgi:CHAT domain-containing protein